jgi:hypothetical protein
MTNVEVNRPRDQAPNAGWYANPGGDGLRWWDGSQWTDHLHPVDSAAAEPVAEGRHTLLDRWPLLLGGLAVVAAAVVAFALITGGDGSSSADSQEQAVTQTVDDFLAAVAAGDQNECERFIDSSAEPIKRYLHLAEGVPGSQSTCGFVGGRVDELSVDQVTVDGNEARVTFDGNATAMHLSRSGGRWVIDGIG